MKKYVYKQLNIYVGMYDVQDEDNLASFQTAEVIAGAKAFADKLSVGSSSGNLNIKENAR